ncbi:aspartate-semialdehyde dehydrogenase, partial [Candidatus Carsonella ruddii]|nr:aspartate-semialdehyde dehydrogenase [Candidatus Carsonella ruddii]
IVKKLINNLKLSFNLENDLLKVEKNINFVFKKENPILYNAIPWIDKKVNFSQTKEEWKSQAEASKILNKKTKIDSNCVRITSLRCHSQFFLIKFNKKINLNNIYEFLNNKFLYIVKNNENNSSKILTPYNVCGKLKIFVGRIKKSLIDEKIFSMFSIGDQLLWGAAEPIKRFLEIIVSLML